MCSADANQMSSSTLRPRPGIDCPTGDRLATIYDTSLVYAAVSSAGKDQWIIDGTRCASLRRSISKQAKLRQRKPRHTVDGAICVDDSENHQTEKCDPECSKALITGRKCVPNFSAFALVTTSALRFLPLNAKQSAVLLWQVVRPSVRLSVTLKYCDHIGWNTKLISQQISITFLVSANPGITTDLLQREHPKL